MRRLLARLGAARSMLLWRRPWIAVVAVVAAVAVGVLVGAAAGPPRATATEELVVAPPAAIERAPTVPNGRVLPPRDPDAPTETVGVGDRAADGDVEYRVDALAPAQRVAASSQFGGSDPPITALPGRQLWRMRITATNRGDESGSLLCAPSADGPAAFLTDGDRFYGPATRDDVRPSGSEDGCDDALPGRSTSTVILFVVPEGTRLRGIALWDQGEIGDLEGQTSWVLVRR